MIADEERAALKVGDNIYYVDTAPPALFESEVRKFKDDYITFHDGSTSHISDKHLFLRKIDALRELKNILSLDEQIKQLEQEDGK